MTVPAQVLAAVRSIPHPRQEPDMTAPHPSPAEQAVIDRFGIFEAEENVEKVARAIEGAEEAHGPFYFPCQCGWEAGFGVGWEERGDRHRLLSLAAAAIAVMPASPAEEALRRLEALAQELATLACDHHASVAGDAYADAADWIIAVIEGTYP